MWMFYSIILLSVVQIQRIVATGCNIVSVTSPSASSLKVVWSAYEDASYYLLDLRVENSTSVAPVVVMQSAPTTERLIQGLRPGHVYLVKLKVFEFYTKVCTASETAMTVPATSQITLAKAISSTSIIFEWSEVTGAENYILYVEEFIDPTKKYNQNLTTQSGQMDGLTPSTTYKCYVQSSNIAGLSARSNIRTITTLVQPPTGVTLVSTGKNSIRVTWDEVDKVLLYQVNVTDDDSPSNGSIITNTPATSMDIAGLEPCSNYTVGVSSLNPFLLPGEPFSVSHSTATIKRVTSVSADYSCTGSMVTVTWDLVTGANLYRASAIDDTGEVLNCTSASTSCQIAMLKCGEKYNVYVTAISDDCESTSNSSAVFETVPCAPAVPQTTQDCSRNGIVFSWQPTNNTLYYVATAVDDDGKEIECRTTETMCYFTSTSCGQSYRYTVYSVSSGCNSEVSRPEFVQTAPCLPTNIKTAAGCHSDSLFITWDSAAGALSYTVNILGNYGESHNCTTSSTNCTVTGVPCGEQLSVWIFASNDNCSTNKVLGEVAQTVPCTPTNVSASVGCSQDSARVNWTTSIGVILYIAVAQDSDGNSYGCYSMGTTCMIEGLRCGQNYTASVIGTNFECNSTTSETAPFMTAPCPPTNVEASRNCDTNHALITWENHQPTGLYTAIIEDQSGAQLTCSSNTVNSCKITSLPCGVRYSVTVTYQDGNCPSMSEAISMDSVPCGPQDVQASVACITGELTVTWNMSAPAENYTTAVSKGMGPPIRCNSSQMECVVGGLACGSSYVVTVSSVTGTCISLPSTNITVQTLPCPPTNISVIHTCAPNPVPVSWIASQSAEFYTAVAESSKGHMSECSTNSTSCSFSDLQCGQVYTIGVAGVSENCKGQQSQSYWLFTEPCVPSNVSSLLDCDAKTAQVSWTPSVNAISYAVKATSSNQTLTCQSSSQNCTLMDLVCGHSYDIAVMATDDTCSSNYSAPFRQEPVPCAPVTVNTTLDCGTNNMTVTWSSTSVALDYRVTAVPVEGGTSVACNTDTNSCNLSGLQCGQSYNITAQASSGSCSGPSSTLQIVQAAPCPPQGLIAVLDCSTKSVQASWNASNGATSYVATITGPHGFSQSHSSANLTCFFSDLQCASQYNVTVTSQNSQCISSASEIAVMTGPCDPTNVTAVLQCGSDMATVSWDAAAGAVAYTVLAQHNDSPQSMFCRSNTTSCQLNNLHCGKSYNLTVLAEDVTCNSTGDIRTILMTAPCAPTIQTTSLICDIKSSSLSWLPMADSIGYVVNATATSGHKVSCSSVSPTCILTDLLCGETYTATVTAQGNQCDSAPGPSSSFTTAPCSPANISTHYTCETSTVEFNWADSFGSLGYVGQIFGGGYEESCRTADTSCAVHNLPCGLDLNVTVKAEGAECNSTLSDSEIIKTVPCAPENISATLVCSNHSALVTWVGSAVGFMVTTTGQDGHKHQCSSNNTSCQLSDIHCGETYDVIVTPYSNSCTGPPSTVYSLKAGLCPPNNVTVSSSCEDDSVSWSTVTGAEMYIATATANDGHYHTCSSNSSSSCQFSDLRCGESYSVSVLTVDGDCWSEPSTAVELKTALCPPKNLTGRVSCDTSSLTLAWDESAVPGTATYILQAERIGSFLPPEKITTSNTSHILTDLLCGHKYAFRIAEHDGDCNSSYSPPIEITTAPCQPTNFSAHVDCGTNKAHFTWGENSGADFYTVEVTGEHGKVSHCSSNGTSCSIVLHCGRSYSAALVASTGSCDGSKNVDIHFDSAPCLPEDVFASVDCETNEMNVTWTQTPGSDEYTAWAISAFQHRTSCNSTSNSCSILDLQCGQMYEVVVTSSSIHCDVVAGSDYKVQSAPCKPENTTVDLNCSSNILTVMWDQINTTQDYVVNATSALGFNSTCVSSGSDCFFSDLSCGQLYTFTVTGQTTCSSKTSPPIEKLSAPCPPTNVSAVMNCTTREALVSWRSAAAAAAYSVQATSLDGYSSSCSEMGTSCRLNNLFCGQEYEVLVESMHAGCPGPASVPIMLITDPCIPLNVSVQYNLTDTRVLWAAASGANYYSVQATTDEGLTASCRSDSTNCSLTGLQCSQIYNLTVTAHNQACDSSISDITHLRTVPCPPTNVKANMACEELTATVSWELSELAVGYVAIIEDRSRNYYSCVAAETDTNCVVSGLLCGAEYNVWVKALGFEFNSSDSNVISLTSGPCQPDGIVAIMDCETQSSSISWQAGLEAVSYITEITASSGHTAVCVTNHTNCYLSSLQCGEDYNVTVLSLGNTCNRTAQMTGYLTTEPCVPVILSVDYNMSIARVQWSAARGARSYSVQAVTDHGLTGTCNTSSTQCELTGLQCSQIYNVTVTTHNLVCKNTATSETYHLMTEPCPPANVQTSMSCENLEAAVSWEQSDFSIAHVAYFSNEAGHYTSCAVTNPDTSCAVSGLMCGTEYDVWVKALGEQYNSSNSEVISLTSAPCLPSEIEVEQDCNSDGAATVSWNSTFGVANFSLTAIGNVQTLCLTQQNSCKVTGLNCGETYNLSLIASNTQCSLTARMHANLTTRPCPPQRVTVDLQCGSHTAVLSWEESTDVELYKAKAITASGGEQHKCNSTGSSCQFFGLACGETYNLTVTALSHGCCSQASNTVFIQTEPCQPVVVYTEVFCQNEEVHVSWNKTNGVENYLITARGGLGYVEIFNTTETLLSAVLPCGQNYSVTVQGRGSNCDSIPSSPAFFKTTPCIPWDVMTYIQCEFNVGAISWGASDGAEKYVAVAIGLDGHIHECATNTTSCTWDDLHCGEQYVVMVRAEDEECTSLPSNSSIIHTAPCLPQNLIGSVNCDTKLVSLSWDASNGTEMYEVTAESGTTAVELTTNITTVHFSEFVCGQMYSLTVTAHSQQCPSIHGPPSYVQTWPCPAEEISTTQDCLSGIVLVTWKASNGTEFYTATMNSDNGVSQICMSDSNECSVPGLSCGHNFSVSVTASNQQCNVTSSAATSLESVPCVPSDVSMVMDCDNNTAVVSWSASQGALQYSLTAYSSHGNASCQTSELSCNLNNLICGSNYTVHVIAMDDSCSSIPSQGLMFHTAPCPPHNVSSQIDCLSNDIKVLWDAIREAEYFLVSVSADSGGSILEESYNTTHTTFSISDLTCGKTFIVQVTSVRGLCHSQHSQTHQISTGPCQPQNIGGNIDCVTNSAWIFWDAAGGADGYTVSAVGEEDHIANCSTSTNTSCEVEDLECGVLYNFSVVAKSNNCNSQPSAIISLQTAPCTLAGITAFPQCHNSSILVVWELMEGSQGNVYTATAEGSDRTFLSCNDTGTSCTLYGAHCDLRYTIIVAASSDQCNDMRSPPYRLTMEPCPPSNVMATPSCEDYSASVSWTASPVAEIYSVVANSVEGHVHTCNSTSDTCSLSELQCDQEYTVSVTASHENCSSRTGQNVTFNTGPCSPDGLSFTYNCTINSAMLSWTSKDNAVEFYGCAQAANGDMLYCHSEDPFCTIEGLECGTIYNFSIQASDGICNSSFSRAVQVGAAPCPPDAVEVQLMPMEMEIQILHFSWTQINCSDTEHLLKLTGNLLGNPQTQFEVSSYWTNMRFFEIPLPCGSSYVATLESRNAAGTSDPSQPLNGTTAPCPPSGVVYSGNSSFATVSWNESVFATTYTVYDGDISPSSQLCSTEGLSCSFSNIASTTLAITASNAAGESEGTLVTIVVTNDRRRRDLSQHIPETGLQAPILDVTPAMTKVVFVEWTEVDTASYYSLLIRQQGSSDAPQELTVYGESIILTDLSSSSTYCFAVLAKNETSSGPESEPVCVQTGQEPLQ